MFTTTGTWTSFNNVSGYYGYNFLLASGPSTAAARWRPSITTSGIYKIYMKWTAYSSRADRVPVEINYDGGNKTEFTRRLDQTVNGGVWVYLGSYFLRAGTGNSVRITAGDSGLVCADAVLFELAYATTTSPTEPALTTAREEYDEDYGKITRPDAAPVTVYYNGGSQNTTLSVDQTATRERRKHKNSNGWKNRTQSFQTLENQNNDLGGLVPFDRACDPPCFFVPFALFCGQIFLRRQTGMSAPHIFPILGNFSSNPWKSRRDACGTFFNPVGISPLTG